MLHESEKFQFNVLLIGYLAVWLGLTLLPYVMDISHWAGISRLCVDLRLKLTHLLR